MVYLASHYKSVLTDDEILEVMILIEACNYLGATRYIRNQWGLGLQDSYSVVRAIAASEMQIELKEIKLGTN